MGTNGPIKLGTDNINIDSSGTIYSADGKTNLGKLSVVDFANYDQLIKEDNGVFSSTQQGTRKNAQMQWKYIEKSNVDATQEMTDMMSGQRSLQSSAQVLKMYDQLMGKIVSEIGRL
ncbi:MAG: flagellar basal body rod C-terminal domain-containing protein [Lachnospiraceae bacterium]|nr:flagellar basal body rod C-terminal domain-containing protein [Lachnospiraceae bacterium]